MLAGRKDVVAGDSCDLQGTKSHRPRQARGFACRGERIGRPHIGDDLDASSGTDRQHRAHPLFEQGIVAGFRILQAGLLGESNGTLAQAFEHEILNVALFGEFQRRLDAIARIARA